ncbi:hypothetical protein OJE16_10535 [Pantoea tagorei]
MFLTLREAAALKLIMPSPGICRWFPSHSSWQDKKQRTDGQTIAPYTKKTFWFNNIKQRLQGAGTATLAAINDQGARISEVFAVKSQQP